MVFHPNYYGTVYLGEGDAFWKSIDRGVTFNMLHDFGGHVRYLDISYHHPEVLYADVVGQGLHRSADGGFSWEARPSLTSGEYANANWKGKTHFVISPADENVIYACLSNGAWSGDIGSVFRSEDGGITWEDWTSDLNEYTKSLVIQLDEYGDDIVYLFTNSKNGQSAKVFLRREYEQDWESYSEGYPAGMSVNYPIAFYRDGKLRVAGNGGVWESPLEVEDMAVLVNPCIEQKYYDCSMDTIYFNDHSMMNHEAATWHWDISPDPLFIEDADMRNPKVILGDTGYYSVTLTVHKNGQDYVKTMEEMIWAGACSSIENCDNPAELPKDIWELFYVDSEEVNDPGLAIMSFDDDPATIWHTRWSTGTDSYPHEIVVDLGMVYQLFNFTYLPRQDGENGRINDYTLYVSSNGFEWIEMHSGSFENTAAPQKITFDETVNGRFFKLIAHSEVNGNEWASAAEFSMVGCTDLVGVKRLKDRELLKAFPMPVQDEVQISLPAENIQSYEIISLSGQVIAAEPVSSYAATISIPMDEYQRGLYMIRLRSDTGVLYSVKVIKE